MRNPSSRRGERSHPGLCGTAIIIIMCHIGSDGGKWRLHESRGGKKKSSPGKGEGWGWQAAEWWSGKGEGGRLGR